MARFEMSNTPDLHSRIAVGYADAKALCAEWVPITVEASAANIWEPPGLVYDLVFFGSLEYLPNIEALEYIANIWPIVKSERPATTLLVAGARPTERVKAMVSRCGWSMWEDFDDIGEMLSHARLSLVPLRHASGMQTKVLDAASHGIPQVVSAVGLAGFSPGFPARVADSESEFIEAILSLLESRDELLVLGEASKAHVLTEYSVERWVDWADRLSL
ncbi:MAG: glycosyltransferase [Microthrixaceae bacterium]|nr:glycosyltransferase [Microthrixaceae bacterium]